ncbi:hypothetical protein SAMN05446635_5798 [Burkholderia sp. OK233]|nr:hypothetical protein SAMN05446635_5798 [Burkholderia sp. OK233]
MLLLGLLLSFFLVFCLARRFLSVLLRLWPFLVLLVVY